MATTNETDQPDQNEEDGANEVLTGSLSTESLPHKYQSEGLSLSFDKIRLDGSPLGDQGKIVAEERFLSLVDVENWEQLQITGTIELTDETIQEIFPADEWSDAPGRIILVKTNPLAVHRSRVVVEAGQVAQGRYEFSVDIDREQHRGDVTLQPFVVRGETRESGAPNCATKVGSRLTDGIPWVLELDEPTDGGSLLRPVIEEFDKYDRLPDDDHIHYLSLEEPKNPQLFLNRNHPTVVNILENTGSTGGPPRLRDLLYDYIEHSVWIQLLVQTARDTDVDTGETTHDWQEDVLDMFLEDLYPEQSREEGATTLAEEARNIEDLPSLIQNIEKAVHKRFDVPDDATKLVEEAIQSGN